MAKLSNLREEREITIINNGVDVTAELLDLGGWKYDEETDTYINEDADFSYMIDQMTDLKYGVGDFRTDEPVDPDAIELWVDDNYVEIT